MGDLPEDLVTSSQQKREPKAGSNSQDCGSIRGAGRFSMSNVNMKGKRKF
jgi:hypothetical protein